MVKASDLYESSIRFLAEDPQRALRLADACNGPGVDFDVKKHQVDNLVGTCMTKIDPTGNAQVIRDYFSLAESGDPGCEQYSVNLAYSMLLCGNPSAAEVKCREILAKSQDYEDAYVKLYNAQAHSGNYFGELATQKEMYRKFPNDYNKMAMALTELLVSDMVDPMDYYFGLRDFQCRYSRYDFTPPGHDPSMAVVERLKNAYVNIYLEQGLGDCIMLIPYIQKAARYAAEINIVSFDHDSAIDIYKYLGCFGSNVKLHRSISKITNGYIDLWSFDLLTLGRPSEVCPSLGKAENKDGKVGICWRGNPAHPNDPFRSMRFKDIMPLVQLYGSRLLNLQSNLTDYESNFLKDNGVEVTSDIVKYDSLIERLTGLKSVITVDTFMSHISGVLGVPCYTLLPVNVDWRWGRTSRRTPWYNNHTLIRQQKCQEWGPVIDEVSRFI